MFCTLQSRNNNGLCPTSQPSVIPVCSVCLCLKRDVPHSPPSSGGGGGPFSQLLLPWCRGLGGRTGKTQPLVGALQGSCTPYPYLVLGGVSGAGRALAVAHGGV